MKDAAGNYLFTYEGNNYKIMKMGWREQREFIKIFTTVPNEFGVVTPCDDNFNIAQDWLLPKIAHVNNGLQYLKDDYLEMHLETFGGAPVQAAVGIFVVATKVLSDYFFQEGSNQNNLNQDAVMSLENTDLQAQLSKTFN